MTRIIVDRFPCHLSAVPAGFTEDINTLQSDPPTEGAKYLEVTRVLLTEEAIIVAKDSHKGPQIVFQEKYKSVDISKNPKEDTRVVTVSGKMLAFKKDTNCGCGSRLRGWNPYKTLNSIKDQ